MSTIDIRQISITELDTDIIVNAANAALQAGGGVCGAIFKAAGYKELQEACDKIGHCDTGFAVITPAFRLKAKYVIHAVGPVWQGGKNQEPQQLYSCYRESLRLARKYNCHSIAFPLISSGIYGYPKDQAWRKAIQACRDFFQKNEDYDIDVIFAVLEDEMRDLGREMLEDFAPEFAKGYAPSVKCGSKTDDKFTWKEGDLEIVKLVYKGVKIDMPPKEFFKMPKEDQDAYVEAKKKGRDLITEWRPVSFLKPIDKDISGSYYYKKYAEKAGLFDRKKVMSTSYQPVERVNFFEALEVKEENGEIYYRENNIMTHREDPKRFETQFGTFVNHNQGEFMSWMEKEEPDKSTEKVLDTSDLFPHGDSYISGNFCDAFDCGKYVFAVSNLMHMGLGSFSIIRINENLETETIFDNHSDGCYSCLEYIGKYRNEKGWMVLASGIEAPGPLYPGSKETQKKTILYQITPEGDCNIAREFGFSLSSPNSMIAKDGFVWLGQNKMVTCLDLPTGELHYYTNKSGEDLASLYDSDQKEECSDLRSGFDAPVYGIIEPKYYAVSLNKEGVCKGYTKEEYENSLKVPVQAFVNNIAFPKTLEEVLLYRDRGSYNVEDILMDDEANWTAPNWAKVGDIVFFMHSKTAIQTIRKLCTELKNTDEYDEEEKAILKEWLDRGRKLYNRFGGKIYAYGRVSGSPEGYYEDDVSGLHWKSRIYADIEQIRILADPVDISEFKSFLLISRHGAITPVYGTEFEKLKELILQKNNTVADYFVNSMAAPVPLAKIDDTNWLSVTNKYRRSFLLEQQFRSFYVDRFLSILGDQKTFYRECRCRKIDGTDSFVDNIILFNGKYLPVEIKLNVKNEVDLPGQVKKYCNNDVRFTDHGAEKPINNAKSYMNQVLIIDTESVYLYDDRTGKIDFVKNLDDIQAVEDIKAFREGLLLKIDD